MFNGSVEELSNNGPAERSIVELLRAALLVWLEERDRILSDLSGEDGEWPVEDVDLSNHTKIMNVMMSFAQDRANAATDDTDGLICAVLDEQSKRHGYTQVVNWSLYRDKWMGNGAVAKSIS